MNLLAILDSLWFGYSFLAAYFVALVYYVRAAKPSEDSENDASDY